MRDEPEWPGEEEAMVPEDKQAVQTFGLCTADLGLAYATSIGIPVTHIRFSTCYHSSMAPAQLSSSPEIRATQIAAAIQFNNSRPPGARKSTSPAPRKRQRPPLPPVDRAARLSELDTLSERIKSSFKGWESTLR